jgi:hypothetical protein
MKVEILKEYEATKGLAFLVEVNIYENGEQIIPSSATITVKSPFGEVIINEAEMTINQAGTLSYMISAEKLSQLWENAIIEINYVADDRPHKSIFYFDVVICPLKPTVTDTDLKTYFPQLGEEIWDGETNYDKQIQEAFKIIKRDIKNKGRRPSMLLDSAQIRELLILKAFELIFFDFAKSEDDIWWKRYEEMKEKYKTAFENLLIKYDQDQDSLIDSTEKTISLGQIVLER